MFGSFRINKNQVVTAFQRRIYFSTAGVINSLIANNKPQLAVFYDSWDNKNEGKLNWEN